MTNMAITLNDNDLKAELKSIVIANGAETDPEKSPEVSADEWAADIMGAIKNYIQPLLDDYNSHTHGGVIIGVTGGSGAPAVGVTGNTTTPN